MEGFRSLADEEIIEFECRASTQGLEATHVSGPCNGNCLGSTYRPITQIKNKKYRKIR